MDEKHKYSIDTIWSDEDEGFIATCKEFPGLSAFGETRQEALEEAEIALEGFIEVFKEDGCPLPDPEVLQSYSGQTRLRMPKTLHAELSQDAKKEGVSLNTYIVHLLSERRILNNVKSELQEINSVVRIQNIIVSNISTKPLELRNKNWFQESRPVKADSNWLIKESVQSLGHLRFDIKQ